MTESEIDHASEIIRELLEFIIVKISPAFTVAQIDGDAIFAYAPLKRLLRGESLFELLESTYGSFKDQLLQSSRVRTCGCNACRNISKLDLKFAVHFGEYIPTEFKNQFDLIGLAPHFIRNREWKDTVKETVDWRGYALFTETCLTQLGLHPDDLSVAEIPGGSVRTFGLNLESRYESMLEQRRVLITPQDALLSISAEFPVPPATVWSWVNEPALRTQWYNLRWSEWKRLNGRTGPNAVNHCEHGIGHTIETILDWRPFDYFTSQYHSRPFNIKFQQTMKFEEIQNGRTRLQLTIKPESAGWLSILTCKQMIAYQKSALQRLARLIEKE